MNKNGERFREEQIIYALREVQGGRKIAEICRELGVTEQTYHRWKRKYAGMGATGSVTQAPSRKFASVAG